MKYRWIIETETGIFSGTNDEKLVEHLKEVDDGTIVIDCTEGRIYLNCLESDDIPLFKGY